MTQPPRLDPDDDRLARPAPRLYLETPIIDEAPAFLASVKPLLGTADIAALLLHLPPADERTLLRLIKAVTAPVQEAGIALLLAGHETLVAKGGADGAHVAMPAALNDALTKLKPHYIVGAGGLVSRHDAMVAAESGADYVLFGEADANGHRPSLDAIAERVAWWSELFQPPCVACAHRRDDVATLVEAGADFILLGAWIWTAPDLPGLLTEIQSIIARPQGPPHDKGPR